jgi:hypothetical protein
MQEPDADPRPPVQLSLVVCAGRQDERSPVDHLIVPPARAGNTTAPDVRVLCAGAQPSEHAAGGGGKEHDDLMPAGVLSIATRPPRADRRVEALRRRRT